jgi:sortase B
MEKKDQTETKRNHYAIAAVILVILAVVAGGIGLYQWMQKDKAEEKQEEVKEETVVETPEEEDAYDEEFFAKTGVKIPQRDIDWDALAEENPDIYAWIYIPGTEIDYPVLQREGDDDYYLDHNLDGSSGYPGCIYSQASYNSPDLTDHHTVLYGHDMKNGTMFAGLHDFADATFFQENRYFVIYTPEKTHIYEIYAAYTYSDTHLLYTYDCEDPTVFGNYLEMVKNTMTEDDQVSDDIDAVDASKKIVTLSTCISYKPNNRWLVQGVELE